MKFHITYFDPSTEEMVEIIKEFFDTDGISAHEWAEDYAYTAADKHEHYIEEIKK